MSLKRCDFIAQQRKSTEYCDRRQFYDDSRRAGDADTAADDDDGYGDFGRRGTADAYAAPWSIADDNTQGSLKKYMYIARLRAAVRYVVTK